MNVFATLKTVFFGSKFRQALFYWRNTASWSRIRSQRADAALPDYTRRASGAGYPRGPSSSGIELDSAHRRECSHGQLPLHRVGRRRSKRDGWRHRFFSLKTVRITCRGYGRFSDIRQSQLKRQRRIPLTWKRCSEKSGTNLPRRYWQESEITYPDAGCRFPHPPATASGSMCLLKKLKWQGVENNIPDTHLRYAKVDERWMNSLSLEAIETGIDCWDRDIQRFVRSRRISEYHPFTAYFEQLPEWDGTGRCVRVGTQGVRRPVWVNGFHRWMLGLSAQWMQLNPDNNRVNSVAPLLVSSRQGLGKVRSAVCWCPIGWNPTTRKVTT